MTPIWHPLLLWASAVGAINLRMVEISSIYIPAYLSNGNKDYGLFKANVGSVSLDHETMVVYAIGDSILHAIDISNPDNMKILAYVEMPDIEFTDVEVCGDYVFTAVDDKLNRDNGRVVVFKAYNETMTTMTNILSITVGAVPDMLKPTKDCSKLVVAVEAEGYATSATTVVDPQGRVSVITFPEGVVDANYNLVTLDFTAYNDRVAELSQSGVRHVYQENNNPFSNDVEPEYIALNGDDTKAYITLQENNAVAVVDLLTQTITGVHGLGFKNWSMYSLDPSDRDRGSFLHRGYNTLGMFLPDSVVLFTINGVEYLALANEGDAKEYIFNGDTVWTEETRGSKLDATMTANLDQTTKDQLERDSQLRRLKVSTSPAGMDSSNSLKALYSFGARSFSIRRADDMSLVYDSGDEISRKIFEHRYDLFNSHLDNTNDLPVEDFDMRSDDKGSETESLAVGVVDGVTLIFVGNERPGTIVCYSIESDVTRPVFRAIYDGIPDTRSKTWQQLYDDRELSMIDPEDLHFLTADKSPTGKPALLVTGSVSGTFSIIDIEITPSVTTPTTTLQPCGSHGIRTLPDAVILLLIAVVAVFLHH